MTNKKKTSMAKVEGEEEVKVIGYHGSPMSCRVEMALKIKGVPYELIEENIFNKSPLLLQHNPIHKKIPVLLHNGKPIAESQVILEYIEETWKQNPILPQDPHDKAMARFWAKFIDDSCLPALRKAFWGEAEEREKDVQEACELLKRLENELQVKNSKFFGGESVGFVDIVANFIGFWHGVIEEVSGTKLLTEDKFPLLSKWSIDFVNCNVNKQILTPNLRDELLGFFRARFQDQYFQVK